MLALLEAAYLCDLTCQTGAAGFLGAAGVLQSLAWLGLSIAKLFALAWALRLRLSRSAALVPIIAATVLAGLPHLLVAGLLSPHRAAALVGLCVFGVGAVRAWSRCTVSSALDAGGQSVLRRALAATWIIWGVLGLCHILWLCVDFGLSFGPVLIAVGLLAAARCCRQERWVWIATLGAVAQSIFMGPEVLSAVALMTSAVLTLRGCLPPTLRRVRPITPPAVHPYRCAPTDLRPNAIFVAVVQSWRRAEARRYYTGALVGGYLALWAELGWPRHQLWLDLALTAALLLVVWCARQVFALIPAFVCWGHMLLQLGLVEAPESTVGWGALIIGLGFAALLFGLAINWLARGPQPSVAEAEDFHISRAEQMQR